MDWDEIDSRYIHNARGAERDDGWSIRLFAMRSRDEPLWRMPYQEYLRSAHWRETRRRMLDIVGCRCELCQCDDHLDVHHLNYATLGRENWNSLVVLCQQCHKGIHAANASPTMVVRIPDGRIQYEHWQGIVCRMPRRS